MVQRVYLVFKTHLDIGFTDLGSSIVDKYLHSFIPNAIKRGYEMKNTKTPYVWTTGSWLIWEALKTDDGTLDRAIRDGIVTWHAMPFTSFTEAMSPELMKYALSLSEELDRRYGRHTRAAKMTDVPGHTIGVVPYFARQGISFLHLGINTAYPLPDLPPIFRWKNGKDEVIIAYNKGYGADMVIGDFALTFGFTGDNLGPHSREQIEEIYASVRERYPGAKIIAGTLDDLAIELDRVKDTLPVITQEIGDPWIQNVGTDPQKVSRYKALLRYIAENGITSDISDSLLVVPEHTWGGDVKVFWPDYVHYTMSELAETVNDPGRKRLEESWEEKRRLLDAAENALGVEKETVTSPDLNGFLPTKVTDTDFEVSCQFFDTEDYKRFFQKCLTYACVPNAAPLWAAMDNSKFGLPKYNGGIFTAKVTCAYRRENETWLELHFDEETERIHGLPVIWAKRTEKEFHLITIGQKANRLPQALWLKFTGLREKWEICKLGQWIDTDACYQPLLMATSYGVRNPDWEIEMVDSLLAAPHGRHMLDRAGTPLQEDMYFNLYNNVWGCNQPMWTEGNAQYRFRFTPRDSSTQVRRSDS